MENKLLNLMLYRQTLLQNHLCKQLKEIQMQLQIQKSFLSELKNATDYFKSEFGKNELAGFPVEITTEVDTKDWKKKYLKNSYQNTIAGVKNVVAPDNLFEGRNPTECLE